MGEFGHRHAHRENSRRDEGRAPPAKGHQVCHKPPAGEGPGAQAPSWPQKEPAPLTPTLDSRLREHISGAQGSRGTLTSKLTPRHFPARKEHICPKTCVWKFVLTPSWKHTKHPSKGGGETRHSLFTQRHCSATDRHTSQDTRRGGTSKVIPLSQRPDSRGPHMLWGSGDGGPTGVAMLEGRRRTGSTRG